MARSKTSQGRKAEGAEEMITVASAPGSKFCWWCNSALVGPGGVKGKEPLHFRLVTPRDGTPVRVHVGCENRARDFIEGQPSEDEP